MKNTGEKFVSLLKKYGKKLVKNEKDSGGMYTSGINAAHLEKDAQFQKYHNTRAGHGFAAEDANALNDTLHGRRVEKTGLSNELDGPDRIVDGVQIQTKYYSSPSGTFNSALDSQGRFRYPDQLLEVPSDQYEQVCELVQEKIDAGTLFDKNGKQISGDAKDIVKKGHVTYEQAKNIAKAGTIDSIKFDIQNQAITTGCVMGASMVFSIAFNMWNGTKNFSEAAQDAMFDSLKSGATSMFVGVLSAQVLRTQAAAAGVMASRSAVKCLYQTKLGKKTIEKIAEACLGKAVSGAAAINNVAKFLRSNAITGAITLTVVMAPGFYRSLFEKSQSWKQFAKDFSVAVAGMAGGIAGFVATAARLKDVVPGPWLNLLGGVGGMAAGALVSFAAKKIADQIVDDDAVILWNDIQEVLEELAKNYLLTEQEVNEQLLPHVQRVATAEWLRMLYKKEQINRRAFIYETFTPFCDSIVKNREHLLFTDQDVESQASVFLERMDEMLSDPWMLNAKKELLLSCDIYSADENQKLYNFAIGLRICTSKDCPCDGIKMAAFFQDSIVFLDDNADIYRLHDDYSWEHIDNLSNTIDDYYKIKIMRSIKNKLYLFTESHIYISENCKNWKKIDMKFPGENNTVYCNNDRMIMMSGDDYGSCTIYTVPISEDGTLLLSKLKNIMPSLYDSRIIKEAAYSGNKLFVAFKTGFENDDESGLACYDGGWHKIYIPGGIDDIRGVGYNSGYYFYYDEAFLYVSTNCKKWEKIMEIDKDFTRARIIKELNEGVIKGVLSENIIQGFNAAWDDWIPLGGNMLVFMTLEGDLKIGKTYFEIQQN